MALVYGLHDLETQASEKIQSIGMTELRERLDMWNGEVSRVYNAIFGMFTRRDPQWNVNPQTRVRLANRAKAQFVDENGVAKPQYQKGYVDQGFPLWRYELAMGFTFEAMQKATVQEYSDELMRIMNGDMAASMDLFWFTVFYGTNWTYASTEDEFPDISVKAFANSDTETYIVRGQNDPQTATHYKAQAAAISDAADPFPADKDTMTSYAGTTANDRIVCFVGDATNVENIRNLSGFFPIDRSQNITWSANVSLTDPGADIFLGMGDTVLGEHEDGITIVRKRDLPANYLVYFNLDAPEPIGIREDSDPALQGLFNINAVENAGNTLLSRYRRKIGFAPVNRTGVLVRRIGNASYAAPSPYDVIPG